MRISGHRRLRIPRIFACAWASVRVIHVFFVSELRARMEEGLEGCTLGLDCIGHPWIENPVKLVAVSLSI